MLEDSLIKLRRKQSLDESGMSDAMSSLMGGKAGLDETVEFLLLLRDKGETKEEIMGAVKVLREKSLGQPVDVSVIDTCGTGGDGQGTFNISTASAFVVAGAGIAVAKHGNRSVSSKCGSADVLEALGVPLDLSFDEVVACLKDSGFGFFFAPRFHPAMKNVAEARKKIGTRTIFNLLGPLINPVRPTRQVIGLYDPKKMTLIAEVLRELRMERVFLVHGEDGLDEVTLTGKSRIVELHEDKITEWELDPKDYGFEYAKPEDLKGSGLEDNVTKMKALLGGYVFPLRNAVLLNSALALMAAGRAKDVEEGLALGNRSLDQGMALKVLEKVKGYAHVS